MKKIKKVFKYATGQSIPEGAIYCSTQVEKTIQIQDIGAVTLHREENSLVWHYFLVEVNTEE